LIAANLPKISVGISTDTVKAPNEEGDEDIEEAKPIEQQLKSHEKNKLKEKEIELEMKKEELQHFYGSKAFSLMKNLSNQVVKKYLDEKGKQVDTPHFPWIKEYKRFMEK